MEKGSVKVKERLVMTMPLRLLLVFRTHWQVKAEVSGRQTVARVNLGPEIAAILLKILLGSTCDNAEIL